MIHRVLRERRVQGLVLGILAIFVIRTLWAMRADPPRLNDVFTALTLAGSLVVLGTRFRYLTRGDWAVAAGLGVVVGLTMLFATLYTPYPVLGILRDQQAQALVRATTTVVTALCGLAIMREGGPVRVWSVQGEWHKAGRSLALGLGVGAPLAVLNVLGLRFTQGRLPVWQDPRAALVDALQPGIVEEVVYRFAFMSLIWLVLRRPLPGQAAWLAGWISMLVHNFMHFDDLLLAAPGVALGMGALTAVVWGMPLTYLAIRRGLESAIAFHWLQDALRFLAGF